MKKCSFEGKGEERKGSGGAEAKEEGSLGRRRRKNERSDEGRKGKRR